MVPNSTRPSFSSVRSLRHDRTQQIHGLPHDLARPYQPGDKIAAFLVPHANGPHPFLTRGQDFVGRNPGLQIGCG
jgi:hypothetical protein